LPSSTDREVAAKYLGGLWVVVDDEDKGPREVDSRVLRVLGRVRWQADGEGASRAELAGDRDVATV